MPAAFDLMAAAFDLIAAAFDLNTAALNQMLQNKFIPQHLLFGLHRWHSGGGGRTGMKTITLETTLPLLQVWHAT